MEKCLRDGDKAAAAKTKRAIQHPVDTELVGHNTKEEGMNRHYTTSSDSSVQSTMESTTVHNLSILHARVTTARRS